MSKLALNVLVYAIRARGRMAALPRRNLESFLYNGEDSCSGPPSFHHWYIDYLRRGTVSRL